MMSSDQTHPRRPLASAWILAGLIGVTTFAETQVVAAQTGSHEQLCEVAESFAAADRETIRVAKANREQQLAAQETWHQALAALADVLPAGDARSAAEVLRGAQTVASDEPWTGGQEKAYRVLAGHLEEHCNIELPR
ncbi:MAG: hypothetical protein ACREM1_22700 [Longimicrobiales bacterium]